MAGILLIEDNVTQPILSPTHTSVLASEAISLLVTRPDGIYIDGTTGLGGHAGLMAQRLSSAGYIIAIDRDDRSLAVARIRLSSATCRVSFYQDNFKNIPLILNGLGIEKIHGLLLDLGVSTFQMLNAERGFSFQGDGPLDMRMDLRQKTTAADLVNKLPEKELADIFYRFGEERRSRAIARKIVSVREKKRFASTLELASLVEMVLGPKKKSRIHPATKTFQALRIAVNGELEGLEDILNAMVDLICPGGRMVVISFHSLEDRIVKRTFQKQAGRCICRKPVELCICPRQEKVRLLTRRPVKPSENEVRNNPRSRSARMRAIERIETDFSHL